MSCLIVFDLDGTLVDSARDIADTANAVLASYGAPPLADDAIVPMIGDGARVLVERALDASGLDPHEPDALSRFRVFYAERLVAHTRPYDGIVDVVHMASSIAALAVLTNKPGDPTRKLLDAFALSPRFRWVIGGDEGHARKPDPAGLRRLIELAGVSPSRTLFIGDSIVDVETARRAGTALCLASYGFGQARGPVELNANELRVDAPIELTEIIAEFVGRA